MRVSFLAAENPIVRFDMVHFKKIGYYSKKSLGDFSIPNYIYIYIVMWIILLYLEILHIIKIRN